MHNLPAPEWSKGLAFMHAGSENPLDGELSKVNVIGLPSTNRTLSG